MNRVLNNAEKGLIYCRFLEVMEASKGIVDLNTFCIRYAITVPYLLKEVMLANAKIKDICESFNTFDNLGKFASYYTMSTKDAKFLMDMYNKNENIIKI